MMNTTKTAQSGARVLYIEDDPVYAQLVTEILTPLGCRVDLAECGRDGLSAFASSVYDIVAIDYMLPDMSGIAICRELRTQAPDLPLVVITGKGKASTPIEAMTLDVPHYLEKGDTGRFSEGLVNTFTHLIGTLQKS